MLIHGQFRDIEQNLYTISIQSDYDSTEEIEIGVDDGTFFTGEPVIIETDTENMREHLIKKTAVVNLLLDNHLVEPLFANNAHSVIINVMRGESCVFAGYAEPNTYNQGYALPLEEYTLNCTDALTTLQYLKYKNITESNYETQKKTLSTATFYEIIYSILGPIINEINISTSVQPHIYYDCSKGVDSASLTSVFNDLSVSEQYIIGDKADDVWTQEDTLKEILQYLNLHIIQHGFDFYIFDWGTLRARRNTWYDIVNNTYVTLPSPHVVNMTSEMHSANDTNITVDEVYNQFKVVCELNSSDYLIESPLEKNSLYSLYSGRQLYARQYCTDVCADLWRMVHQVKSESEKSKMINWYMKPLLNKNWNFYTSGGSGDITDYYVMENGEYVDMWLIPRQQQYATAVPCIYSLGSVEYNGNLRDDVIKGKVPMSNYLIIGIHGNHKDNQSGNDLAPSEATLEEHVNIMEFTGGGSGVYSPSDDATTNYIVFSGKITLQRWAPESSSMYQTVHDFMFGPEPFEGIYRNQFKDEDTDGKNFYYCVKPFTFKHPYDPEDESKWHNGQTTQPPVYPFDGKLFKYKYSEVETARCTDVITKLPIIECELIIGNKRLIEYNITERGESVFEWVTLGEEPMSVDEDGNDYPLTTFTLGVNPAMDDYIIGKEYDIQNTVSPQMNLDLEGTAIPVTKDDNLHGSVIFRILGPINTSWTEVDTHTHRRCIFWKKRHWTEDEKYLLNFTENIVMKDFQVKLTSQNANEEIYDEKDLIYISDETDKYVNKNEDTTFKFITQPTYAECMEKSIKYALFTNSVLGSDGIPISSIYNAVTNETAKAEEHYVNDSYLTYNQPKVIMQMTVHDGISVWRDLLHSDPLNRNFFIQRMSHNLKFANTTLTLRQV